MRFVAVVAALVLVGCLDPNDKFMDPPDTVGPTSMGPDGTTTATPPTSEPPPPTSEGPGPTSEGPGPTSAGSMVGTDEGETTADATTIMMDTDGTTVMPPMPFCGDGNEDPNEQCDDGNDVDDDACTNACVATLCGDGVKQPNFEDCDDGNDSNTDACTNECFEAACGDAFEWAGFEECDDGNDDSTDACVMCNDAICGDGVVKAGSEECDDGNMTMKDGCENTCKKTVGLLVFVTSMSFDGALGGLPGADDKCGDLAMAALLPPALYRAWLSEANIPAGMRIKGGPPGVPYLNTKGEVIAADWGSLKSMPLKKPILYDENGNPGPPGDPACGGSLVRTNTSPNGMTYSQFADCEMYGSNAVQPSLFGQFTESSSEWTVACEVGPSCATPAPLYCFQEPP